MNYYVYYKVDAARLPALRLSVDQLFKAVNVKFNIEGRWMRRRDDPSTYMEVYEGVTDGKAFESFLEREGTKLGVPRKVECFISSETLA